MGVWDGAVSGKPKVSLKLAKRSLELYRHRSRLLVEFLRTIEVLDSLVAFQQLMPRPEGILYSFSLPMPYWNPRGLFITTRTDGAVWMRLEAKGPILPLSLGNYEPTGLCRHLATFVQTLPTAKTRYQLRLRYLHFYAEVLQELTTFRGGRYLLPEDGNTKILLLIQGYVEYLDKVNKSHVYVDLLMRCGDALVAGGSDRYELPEETESEAGR